MRTIVIIQARMGSSRLPGKVLKPIGQSCVLDYVVARCRMIGATEVVVATSTHVQDDPIVDWCSQSDVVCYRGPEEDVLTRYVGAAAMMKADYVMRVTADCPFVDYELAAQVMDVMKSDPADLVVLEGELPRGLAAELLSYEALLRIDRLGHEPRHREHVTYYATEFPEQFSLAVAHVPQALRHPELRITLDTQEDYDLCRTVAEAFPGRATVPSSEVVRYLLENPAVAAINAHIEQKPVV